MKKVILFYLIIFIVACNQANNNNANSGNSEDTTLEPKTEKEKLNDEEIVSDIREKFEIINQKSDSYETKNIKVLDESTEGGELKSYYQNEELKKVVASYFGEMGKTVEEYYFNENNIFFVFTQQFSYDKPIYVEGSKVNKIDENRYYFHNRKLVRWLDPKKEKVSNSNFDKKETELLQEVKNLKEKLGNSKVENIDSSNKDDDYIDMKSLFSLSPLSIFDLTTDGLSLTEKKELLNNEESTHWKIINTTRTQLKMHSKDPSSEVTLHFLKYKNNLDGVLFVKIVNGDNNNLLSWKYFNENKTLQKTNLLKKYNANEFVSEDDKLPDSYIPVLNYIFIDDQTIEVSLHTWMDKELENREIINKIFLKWNGENFDEKIERIKK